VSQSYPYRPDGGHLRFLVRPGSHAVSVRRVFQSLGAAFVAWGILAAYPGPVARAEAGPVVRKISTDRIVQLTGGYDPEGKTFLNDTVPWGVAGVDLGANTEHNGRLYFFFGDVVPVKGRSWPPYDSDLVAFTSDLNPEPSGFHLTPVTRDDAFYPFTVLVPNGPPEGIQLLRDDTPTGAFSYDGKVFVFFAWHEPGRPEHPFHSSLAWSADPGRPAPFRWLGHVSPKFSQVAPWVISNAALPGLPSATGDGLVLFGQGATPGGHGVVNLAWLPLRPGRDPDLAEVRYSTGSADRARRWTAREADAAPLFKTRWPWSSLSVGRVPGTGWWLLLYQRTARPEATEESIVLRLASTPWDLRDPTETGEVPIFTPAQDGAYRVVASDGEVSHRGYMHRGHGPVPDGLDRLPPTIGGDGFAYGAYLLNRYTRWDPAARMLTLYYLLSTGTPYQVQLMRSRVEVRD
jgi:hypothetical protein